MKVEILGASQHYPFTAEGSVRNVLMLRLPSGAEIGVTISEADLIKVTSEYVAMGQPAEQQEQELILPPRVPRELPSTLEYQPVRLSDDPPAEFGGIHEVEEDLEEPVPAPATVTERPKISARAPHVTSNSMGYPIVHDPSGRDPGEVLGGDNQDEDGVGSI